MHNPKDNGSFRKKNGFTMASNSAIRDKQLSLKAKGLYTLIQSYITLDGLDLTKVFLQKLCLEQETAFDSAWNELKKAGYLKIHMYPAAQGRFRYEYELLDDAEITDGVYLYRYDKNGNVKSTNVASVSPKSDHTPDFHPSGNHPSAEHSSGNHPSDNQGGNIILSCKTTDKTGSNTSIHPSVSLSSDSQQNHIPVVNDGLSDEEIKRVTECEITRDNRIPYEYQNDQTRMKYAIQYFSDWDTYTKDGFDIRYEDSPKDLDRLAYQMIVECLVEMACETKTQTYHGSHVANGSKVIEKLNQCLESDQNSLITFIRDAIANYANAAERTKIRNTRGYMKSVIWTSLCSYKIEFESLFYRTYPAASKEVNS